MSAVRREQKEGERKGNFLNRELLKPGPFYWKAPSLCGVTEPVARSLVYALAMYYSDRSPAVRNSKKASLGGQLDIASSSESILSFVSEAKLLDALRRIEAERSMEVTEKETEHSESAEKIEETVMADTAEAASVAETIETPTAEVSAPAAAAVVEKKKFNKKEWIIVCILALAGALISILGGIGDWNPDKTITISDYSLSLDLMLWAGLVSVFIIPAFQAAVFIVDPEGLKPVFKRTLHVVAWVLFVVCGVLAHMVLTVLMIQFAGLSGYLAHPISMFVVLIYEYLITKLYAYGCLESGFLGWELFRFALVGIVASVADFLCTSLTRAGLNATGLADMSSGTTIITVIAVTVGFAVGVVINYLLSVYMVYKSSNRSTARKWWGVLLFILLSAVGLLIGIGIEAWLYDSVGLSYILVFIIRTVIVLVWNYISRKLILFR